MGRTRPPLRPIGWPSRSGRFKYWRERVKSVRYKRGQVAFHAHMSDVATATVPSWWRG